MSNLSKENVSKLNKVIETCLLAGIENAIVENLKDQEPIIRGINDDRTCLILSNADVPELGEGTVLGLSRMNILRSRVNVLNDDSFEMSFDTNQKNEISVLHLKNKKAKTQFRCASPSIIKAPKAVNDEELAVIEISKSDVGTLNSAAKAMGAKTFTLMCKKTATETYEAFIEYYDANQDVFSIKVADNVSFVGEEATFVYYYISDIFLPLIRKIHDGLAENETSFPLIIGKGGTLRLIINNHVIILVPQTNTEGD
jgi:hypothetical protein